jgi:hypothetical protein
MVDWDDFSRRHVPIRVLYFINKLHERWDVVAVWWWKRKNGLL